MTCSQTTHRANVLERIEVFYIVLIRFAEVFERNVEVSKHFAILVCFSEDDDDIHIIVIGARKIQGCFRRADHRTFLRKGVGKAGFFWVGINLLSRSVGLVGHLLWISGLRIELSTFREMYGLVLGVWERVVWERVVWERKIDKRRVVLSDDRYSSLGRALPVILDILRVKFE